MKYPQAIAMLVLVNACQSPVEQHQKPAATIATDTVSAKVEKQERVFQPSIASVNVASGNDALQASNNTVLHIIPGSNADFAGFVKESKPEMQEGYLIQRHANGRVQRTGNKLLLTLANGKIIALTNDTYELRGDENEEQDKYYQYGGNISGLPYWIVYETLYEAQRTILIHQQTGVRTTLHGEFEISPDNTRLLVSYAGLVYEDDVSTLQLFAIDQQRAQLSWQKSLPNWAPGRTRWLDDRTIAVEQLHLDDSANVSHSSFIRLLFPQ